MLDMWFFTVCSEMARAYATSLFVIPWAMLSRIWTSRGESGANTCDEPGPYTDRSRNSASTLDATAGRLKTFSLMMNWPARALRIASTSSTGSQSLFRYAAAPARIASKSVCSSSFAVRTTTPTCGSSRRMRWVTLMPDVRGRSASMTSTSGSSSSVFAAASSPSAAVPTSSMSASFCRTWLIPIVVRRLESARTTRMFRSMSFVRSILSANGPSSFTMRRACGALVRKLECNGGAFARARLDLKASADQRSALAHRQETDGLRTSRGLHQVEADAVVGNVQDPVARRPLPHDADRGSLRMLVHVLQCLLQHAVDGELLLRRHGGVARVELARHLDAAPRLPLARVVAHRVGEPELGELRRTKVVDHRAHRVERRAELSAQSSQLAPQRLTELGRGALGDALEIVDLEDRVGEDLRGSVVHVAIETLAFSLETLENALRDVERLRVSVWLGLDPRAEEVRDARFDVLHHELKLLEPPVRALRRFVDVATRGTAGQI